MSKNVFETIASLSDSLPEYRDIDRFVELKVYGIDHLIANSLGLHSALPSNTTWLHGWVWDPITHPMQVLGESKPEFNRLVATSEQVRIARENGRANVYSAGLPFLYSGCPAVERLPDSILVMPPHSLPWTKNVWNASAYIEYVKTLAFQFDVVVACVSPACIEKGVWVREFKDVGVPVIAGASSYDRNGLERMRRLLSRFEFVTSCALGSHLPYAAYCGCKVSISGPFYSPVAEMYCDDPCYRDNPSFLEANIAKAGEQSAKAFYPSLFAEPRNATCSSHWGAEQLGAAEVKSPKEIAELFGWSWRSRMKSRLKGIKQRIFHRDWILC